MTKGKFIANFLMNDYMAFLKKRKLTIDSGPLVAEVVGWFADRVIEGLLDKRAATKRMLVIAEENLLTMA